MASLARTVGILDYYARNIVREACPQSVFTRRLDGILERLSDYDAGEIADRVNYYNRLDEPFRPSSSAVSIAAIPSKPSRYYYDLKEYARYFPRDFMLACVFGDLIAVPAQPTIVKSRPIAGDNRNSVLINLDKFRHFYFPRDAIPFLNKKPMGVWRGDALQEKRHAFLRRHRGRPLLDVGHVNGSWAEQPPVAYLSPAEQLQFRYVISIEGYDVATNLKWILASNALCMMSPPAYETWFMEGRLVAERHYAALRPDYADLEEKILYYEAHPAEAQAIVADANAHVHQFRNPRRERLISLLVLLKYFTLSGQRKPDPRLTKTLGLVGPGATADATSEPA